MNSDRIRLIRFGIARHLIHAGLHVMPRGPVKTELDTMLRMWSDHIRATVSAKT